MTHQVLRAPECPGQRLGDEALQRQNLLVERTKTLISGDPKDRKVSIGMEDMTEIRNPVIRRG